jgi:tetratricopeptide (TPR) repeat protein
MAKVPLRKYNSEIEAFIEHGQTDEAIAHCHHILKTFPKHVETYRLLGKAYLESKRHSDATDIFNRILLVVPDDFVSHVGLSIIADDQKRLEDAIWHMERAFEKQPSNSAIQAELQRLYGRRDGREPPKIRLTRGALAHMYYQGELYTQAINEIRSVLAEDASRTDLQVLLALSYFRAGQKVEASETCSQLLSRFPYCLDANRALIEILPGTGMAESANVYRQRVLELDPYAANARGSIFQTDDAPDAAVSLERLEYKGQPVETSPNWGESLGIGMIAAPSASNDQPDWLKGTYQSGPAAPSQAAAESTGASSFGSGSWQDQFEPAAPVSEERGSFAEPATEPVGEDIPEWMRQAGWGTSTGTFDEAASSALAEEPAAGEDLEKADLPDWIKSMAPKESPAPAPAAAKPAGDDDTLDWLNKLGLASSGALQEETLAEMPQAGPSADVPGWSSNFEESAQAPAAAPAETPDWLSDFDKPAQAPAEASADVPDWLSNFDKPAQAPAEASADVPDWLSTFDKPAQAPAQASDKNTELGDFASAAATADWLSSLDNETPAAQPARTPSLTDWLSSLDNEPPAAQPAPQPVPEPIPAAPSAETGIGNLGTSASEQDDAMLWLESLAAKAGAKSEELITKPSERLEAPPAWVEQAKVAGEAQPPAPVAAAPVPAPKPTLEPAPQPSPEPVASAPSAESGIGNLGVSAGEQDAAMLWLESLAAKAGAKSEELITKPEERLEAPPEWVKQAQAAGEAQPPVPVAAAPEPAPQPVPEPVPAAPSAESGIGNLGTSASEQDDAMLWLESLAAKAGAKSEELITKPSERLEAPPAWVEQAKAAGEAQPPEPVAAPASDFGLDNSWLRELEKEESQPEKPVEVEPASWSGEIEIVPPSTGPLAASAPEADLPSWLRGLEGNEPPPATASKSLEDIPDWLKGEEPEVPSIPEPTRPADWMPEVKKTAPRPSVAETRKPAPAVRKPESQPEPKLELKPGPKPEPVRKPEPKPEPVRKPEPKPEPVRRVEPKPEPARRVEPKPEVARKPEIKPETATPIDRSKLRRTGMLPPLVDPNLAFARDAMAHGKIPDALQAYGTLIRKGKLLEEITFDLKEALYRFPVEVSIWQALGDAYMRANRLQDALDAYTKAEELLR